ncbi:hypothetical protein [Ammonifex thiophilus]|uniref:hypothetical protein n=1 Tax=Ammonifex thiophilus TaxID=444093 RepID=UPI00196A93D0|nr:hypothetical protein [Ammonifex thiophilus]
MPHLHGPCKTLRVRCLIGEETSRLLQATVCLYRQVVSFYLQLFHDHQELLERGDWLRQAELLTHRTRDNPDPLYPFDAEFPNLPSGFRRAAIAEARGIALSWKSNYERWQRRRQKHEERNRKRVEKGEKPVPFTERPPVFPGEVRTWPTYYATELRRLDERHILLKVFTGRSFGYRKVVLLDPLEVPERYEAGSPCLVKKRHGWELHFPPLPGTVPRPGPGPGGLLLPSGGGAEERRLRPGKRSQEDHRAAPHKARPFLQDMRGRPGAGAPRGGDGAGYRR